MGALDDLIQAASAKLSAEEGQLLQQALSSLSDEEHAALRTMAEGTSSSMPIQMGMPVISPGESALESQIGSDQFNAEREAQRYANWTGLGGPAEAAQDYANERFGEQVVRPTAILGAGMLGGAALTGAAGAAFPVLAGGAELGFMGRTGVSLANTIAGNLGAQTGMSMVDLSMGEDPSQVANRYYQNTVPGFDKETIFNYAVPFAADRVLGEGAQYLQAKERRNLDMANAFTQNPAHYTPDQPGLVPADEAVARLRGQGVIDDPAILKSKDPMTEAYTRIRDYKAQQGQAVATEIENIPGEFESGQVNPANIVSNKGRAISGAEQNTIDSVLKKEVPNFEAQAIQRAGNEAIDAQALAQARIALTDNANPELAQKLKAAGEALDPDSFFEYNRAVEIVRKLEAKKADVAIKERLAGSSEAYAAANMTKEGEVKLPEFTEADAALLEEAGNTILNYDTLIRNTVKGRIGAGEGAIGSARFSPRDVQDLKMSYAEQAGYRGDSPIETARARQYGDLEANSRALLYQRAREAGNAAYPQAMNQFEAAATLEPYAAARVAQGKVATPGMNPSESLGIRVSPSGKMSPYFYAREAFRGGSSPEAYLRRGMGQSLPQRMGAGMETLQNAVPRGTYQGGYLASIRDPHTIQSQLGVSVDVLKPLPTPPVNIPRSIDEVMRSPDIVGQLIQQFSAPEEAMPRYYAWQRAVASGDKAEIARMLGEISKMSPDFPLARGAVTGLPSEFDMGDGFARLFAEDDKAKWESSIENSALTQDEKALRIMALRQHSLAFPFNLKLNQIPARPQNSPSSQMYQFAPRQQTSFGSRKLEE